MSVQEGMKCLWQGRGDIWVLDGCDGTKKRTLVDHDEGREIINVQYKEAGCQMPPIHAVQEVECSYGKSTRHGGLSRLRDYKNKR